MPISLAFSEGSAFDVTVHLVWGDVAINSASQLSKIRFFLKRSKMDKFVQGVEVFVGSTSNEVCPVRAVTEYEPLGGKQPGPFFRMQDGSRLTKTSFVEAIRQALSRCEVSSDGYSAYELGWL